ncbi:MAG: flagellar export protein FliJ [Candidatus Firestonebacteria bacterium]|nr:flagellar export protein FliJ [Candidatus Firestonebacteria bacterium]
MKKFKFNLEPVLKNCKFKEDILKTGLAEKEKKFQTEKFVLIKFEENLVSNSIAMEKIKLANPKIEILNLYQIYLDGIKKKILNQKKILNLLLDDLNKTRLQLLEIIKQRKVLQKLKEKKMEIYNYELNKFEQNILDEIGIIQFNRKNLGV